MEITRGKGNAMLNRTGFLFIALTRRTVKLFLLIPALIPICISISPYFPHLIRFNGFYFNMGALLLKRRASPMIGRFGCVSALQRIALALGVGA
jgi:hypothetical protein